MEGRMRLSCENKHVKQTPSMSGSGFAAVMTMSMRQRAIVIDTQIKYCKGMASEIHKRFSSKLCSRE